jgi:monoamine oxidase
MSDPDVIVIGAGAAGLAAAAHVAAAGLAVRIVEARGRLGGRAFTRVVGGFPLDIGCGWLHSADENELGKIAAKRGFTINRARPPWQGTYSQPGFPAEDQEEFGAAIGSFFARLDSAGEAAARAAAAGDASADLAGDQCLEPGSRWNPLINAISTYINGVELDGLSARDFWNYRDTEVNWRVVEGYGTLIASLAAGLDVILDCPVSLIDHGGAQVRVVTARGNLAARAVIITVPTNALANEEVRFSPALPDKAAAADDLPLGLADKLFLRLDGAEEFPADSRLHGALDRTATGSYHLRPFGRPLIECYFGGRFARELEAEGEGAFAACAIDQLTDLLGNAMRSRLGPVAESGWARDPFARGSYSHARPRRADARPVLATPVDERLFFAGEACSIHHFSTTHGAYRTGIAAAQAAVRSLGARRPQS